MTDQSRPVLLVLNAGSSSIKFSLYDATPQTEPRLQCIGNGSFEVHTDTERLVFQHTGSSAQKREDWPRNEASPDSGTLFNLMDWIERHTDGQLCAAAHRIVHGGNRSEVAAPVDAALMTEMQALGRAAPLHQPLCLAPIMYLAREHGGLAQFVLFHRRTQTFRGRHPRRTTGGLMRHLRLRDSGQMSANLHSTQRYSS